MSVFKTMAVCVAALSVACSDSPAPTSPAAGSALSGPLSNGGQAVTKASLNDPVTLKVTAPTAVSPINNQKPDTVVLTATAATWKFVTLGPLSYRFLVINPSGVIVQDSGLQSSPTFTAVSPVDTGKVHTWVVRAEYQGTVGPWSTPASFTAPDNVGYIHPTELFDPLTNGKTVGTIGGSGNVTFVPGQGIRMNDELAYVVYQMPTVFSSGEMSVEVTGLMADAPPGAGKPRIFSMLDRANAIASASKYSFNVQYRGAGGAPANCITFKAILGDNGNSLEPDNRFNNIFLLDPSTMYLWQAFWTPTSFRLVVRQGGANGPVLLDDTENATSGTTNWNPEAMYPFLGTNNGAFVQFDGTRTGMTLKNLWVSSAPRPATLP
jgi:hypothetical protein